MHLTSLVLALTASTLTSAATIAERIPRMGAFAVSATRGCPLASQDEFQEFALGAQSNACRDFYGNATYQSINVFYFVPQCLLTLYTTHDCSDPVSKPCHRGDCGVGEGRMGRWSREEERRKG
jgi:hypothetical protein